MNYKQKVGCKIENLRGVRHFIRNALKDHGVPDLQISELVLALDEMCSNLMIHSHRCNPEDLFEINIILKKGDPIIFEIIDDGNTFDINQFAEPDLDNLVQEKRKGGLGIRLVKSIMDKIEYQNRSGKNVCRLIKKIPYK
jgi:serine/threonine-protein kinase RsbW